MVILVKTFVMPVKISIAVSQKERAIWRRVNRGTK